MANVLFVASRAEDYYFLPFVDAARKRGVVVCLLDPGRLPHEATLAVHMSGVSSLSGHLDVLQYDARGAAQPARVSLGSISGAWYIREGDSRDRSFAGLEERFARNETRGAFRSLLSVLPCPWINSYESCERVLSNKLLQQVLAARCGLKTPRTLMSNEPVAVKRFAEEVDGLLVKSIGYIHLHESREYALYSERFDLREIVESEEAVRHCPVFGQEYIEKACEHRVMVIGDEVLSCRIDSQASDRTRIDWRHYDFERVAHVRSELPPSVQAALRRFMQAADLRFGAIDLIETPDAEYVFLEINPSGQWGWIADLAGLPIAEAVGRMLAELVACSQPP